MKTTESKTGGTPSPTDRIQRSIQLQAPLARVWRALSDAREFGTWFRVELDRDFAPGAEIGGRVTYPGYEHIRFRMWIERMEPERLFTLRWHPAAVDPQVDYSKEPTTLVEFRLEPVAGGVRLTVTESGFDKLPAHRRDEAFRMNSGGWDVQVENIRQHVGR
ncbi:MAG: vanillate O-demethylase oxidoreductase VanB [Planctomycetes bacterium]|nr:vanillate O-demethylase oxidoreductase VanB [Planctomycetota bacterium]